MRNAPVTLFVYDRPEHTQRVVQSLLQNSQAEAHDLIIFSDGANSSKKESAVNEVRAYLATISGFRSVTIYQRPYNLGLAKSIITGVTQVLTDHEQIIVLEDDMVVSPYFLTYMNDALERFSSDDRIISIHAYVYPVLNALPEAFFLRGADCWGWATWRRGWEHFNPDGQNLLNELKSRGRVKEFDFNGAYPYSKMLEGQVKGENDSWAVRWYASAFLANKLTLYPGRSLVFNIGNDDSGTHCGSNIDYDSKLSIAPIDLKGLEVVHSEFGYSAFTEFFGKPQNSFLIRLIRKINNFFYY